MKDFQREREGTVSVAGTSILGAVWGYAPPENFENFSL